MNLTGLGVGCDLAYASEPFHSFAAPLAPRLRLDLASSSSLDLRLGAHKMRRARLRLGGSRISGAPAVDLNFTGPFFYKI